MHRILHYLEEQIPYLFLQMIVSLQLILWFENLRNLNLKKLKLLKGLNIFFSRFKIELSTRYLTYSKLIIILIISICKYEFTKVIRCSFTPVLCI